MTQSFQFTVYGPPVPWERAIPLGWGRAVMPKRTRDYQKLVRVVAGLHVPPGWPLRGRYRLGMRFYVERESDGDVDNYVKSVKDAMQGIVYRNDKMVCGYDEAERIVDVTRPRVEVAVRRVDMETEGVKRPLSFRETQVLRLVAQGATMAKVAAELGVAYGTACGFSGRIRAKLGVSSLKEAVEAARKLGADV